MKKKILEIITLDGNINKRRVTESFFKKNHYEIYLFLINESKKQNIPFNAVIYLILNNLEKPPICVMCGNSVRFRKFSEGFSKYCSMKCIGKDKKVKEKREKTSLKKYGVKYTLQSEEKRKQIKETNLKRYGVEFPTQNNKIKDKIKKTNLERYGVESHNQLDSIKEKKKETNLLKYGVENPMQNKEINNKAKETNLRKYGVRHPSQNKEINNKTKKTNLERYGKEFTFQSKEVKIKIKETNLKRYKVEFPLQSEEIRNKVKKTKENRYGNENYNNRDKAMLTSLEKYGVDNPSKSGIIKKKILKKINDNYKDKYSELLSINFNDITIDGDFVTIKNYCNKKHEFKISKSLLYSRLIDHKHENICVKCNPISLSPSILEIEMVNFIKTLNLKPIFNDTKTLGSKLELDIYLPENNFAIEFNGLRWHSELYKNKNYHLNKTELSEKKGIQLYHVFEDEWIYKKRIIKSMIRSKLGIIENSIYARKCLIKEINKPITSDFLNMNHIQGDVKSKIKLGLYYDGKLVSVMTFEKARRSLGNINNDDNFYNLNRYCSLLDTQIVGGASKLLKYFIRKYKPNNVITYADRRYSNGNLYEKIGFKKIHVNKPSYSYFNMNQKIRQHRFNYRKSVVINSNWYNNKKTINENLLDKKIYKIYNSGTIKYQMYL